MLVTCVLRRKNVSTTAAIQSEIKTEQRDIGNQHLRIVGLDCEMVGVGCKGRDNMLARCTMVLWDPHGTTSSPSQTHPDIKVIYDKLVKPTRRVTDYRTEYSGITREMLHEQQPSQPLIDFQTCRGEVRSLLSSIDGKNVLLVGHGETLKKKKKRTHTQIYLD
jgi:DNA polymerase III epsilon subunit-like protein